MSKIGIIAGSGDLPLCAAKNAKKSNVDVYVVAFKNYTDKEIEKYAKTEYFNLGSISAPIKFLKQNGVDKVIFLGTIDHINIFRDLRPDFRAAKMLIEMKDKTPNGIFKLISKELEKDLIEVIDSTIFLKDLIAESGVLTGSISDDDIKQIEYGYKIAKKISEMDIGLSVIIKDYSVVAVEAIEGTDQCIKRAGSLLKGKDFILVKVARPDQDFRFDLPVIGTKTVENMKENGGRIIAIESKKTLIIEKDKTIKLAKKLGISIFGV